MVTLNSKLHISGNLDTWWYNLSNPSGIQIGDKISLNLWDQNNRALVKRIDIQVDSDWMRKIRSASKHIYRNRELCKIHVQRSHKTDKFVLYFGRKTDGAYHIP